MHYSNIDKNRLKENFFLMLVMVLPTLFTSCEKDVVLDLSDQQGMYLIVEGNIDDASPVQWIRISESSSYYDVSKGLPLHNANVKITDGKTSFIFTESVADSLEGYYLSSDIGGELDYGRTYQLIVDHENETYTAQSEYRQVPEIDSVTMKLNFFSSLGLTDETLYDIFIHFRDLPGKGDHYLVDFIINGRLQTGRPSQKTVISDENLEEYVSLSVRTVNDNDLEEGDTLTLKLRSISREQYDFYQIFFFQTDLSGNPFAGAPPANIPTNMSEGARGFFQVSSVSAADMKFKLPNR